MGGLLGFWKLLKVFDDGEFSVENWAIGLIWFIQLIVEEGPVIFTVNFQICLFNLFVDIHGTSSFKLWVTVIVVQAQFEIIKAGFYIIGYIVFFSLLVIL